MHLKAKNKCNCDKKKKIMKKVKRVIQQFCKVLKYDMSLWKLLIGEIEFMKNLILFMKVNENLMKKKLYLILNSKKKKRSLYL